jgi:site-specific recombinase XerD
MFGPMNDASDKANGDLQLPYPQRDGADNASATAMVVHRGTAHAWGADIAERIAADGGGAAATADLARMVDDGHTLGQWTARYMLVKVCGRSPNTVAAKARDLATFAAWFTEHRGHGDIGLWLEADTRRFLRHLAKLGRRPATINRVLFTLKHFARWVHEQPGGIFLRHGLPVAEVECLSIEEPDCKKLTDAQVDALFAAARALVGESGTTLVVLPKTNTATASRSSAGRTSPRQSRARPRRNLGLLAVLYYTGLRVSEVIALTRAQYDGTALYDVARKGGRQTRKLILHPECARLLDDYLAHERDRDVSELDDARGDGGAVDASRPLFVSARTGGRIDRIRVGRMLTLLADKASAMPGYTGDAFGVHAHRLRHTFGAAYRAASGSDTETAAALGHAGLQYVGRYVRDTDAERLHTLTRGLRVPQPDT